MYFDITPSAALKLAAELTKQASAVMQSMNPRAYGYTESYGTHEAHAGNSVSVKFRVGIPDDNDHADWRPNGDGTATLYIGGEPTQVIDCRATGGIG